MNFFSTSLGAATLERPVEAGPASGADTYPFRGPAYNPSGDNAPRLNAPRFNAVVATSRVELVSLRRQALAVAKDRGLKVLAIFACLALVALLQIARLGLFESDRSPGDLGDGLVPTRADIVDRNGVALAREFHDYSLSFNPRALGGGAPLVRSPREVAQALVQIFPDEDVTKLTARLASGKPGYLRRRILPEDANRVHALGEPALEFPRESERFYPQGSLAAHALGYVDAGGRGHLGMEEAFDHRLTDKATRATPAMLSIDARVQGALEGELNHGMLLYGARGAAGIVLDVDTGEVLALASLPSFNPNMVDQNGMANMMNRASNAVFELGSVIKPITIATAIDNGVITDLAKRWPADKPLEIDGYQIHDHKSYGPSLTIPEALVHSSNIVTAQVADQLGGARLQAAMQALGFRERPGIELPARGFPKWPEANSRGEWSRITTMTVSYGHGIMLTPLHLACAYAAMVNGGIWHPATMLRVEPGQAVPGRRIWQASTSARMRQLLRAIVVDGTGKSANAVGFRVGGKTGTAEKSKSAGQGARAANGAASGNSLAKKNNYSADSVVSTFAAAFPMDHPRYVVIALLDEPQANAASSQQRTAAWNAAPIVGRMITRIGPLLGILPDSSRDIDISEIAPLIANGEGE